MPQALILLPTWQNKRLISFIGQKDASIHSLPGSDTEYAGDGPSLYQNEQQTDNFTRRLMNAVAYHLATTSAPNNEVTVLSPIS